MNQMKVHLTPQQRRAVIKEYRYQIRLWKGVLQELKSKMVNV